MNRYKKLTKAAAKKVKEEEKNGDHVKAGDLLADVDLDGIRSEGYRTVTPVIVTNSDAFEHISMEEKQKVTCQDVILEIK